MRWPAVALLPALLAFSGETRADGPADCDSAYEHGQELQRAGKPTEAKVEFERCSQKTCAPFEIADCTRWLHEVERAAPSTPPAAPTTPPAATQAPSTQPPAQAPTQPLAASPPPASQATREKPPSPPGEPRPPVLVYALGGAGLAAIVVGTVVDAKGYFVDTAALSKCSPSCPTSQTNAARTELLVGDVTLGVGIALLGVAAWLYFEDRGADHARTTSRIVADPGGVTFVF
jgi:hypothetical protein